VNHAVLEMDATLSLIQSLNHDARELFPDVQLCGTPENRLDHVPADLVQYVVALLRDQPAKPPESPLQAWRTLLGCLDSHWLNPLLHWKLSACPATSAPPPEIQHQIRLTFLRAQAETIYLSQQIGELQQRFTSAGVPLLILKGPALAWSVYPHPATRPSSDLDVLVLPDTVPAARSLLVELGYACLDRKYDVAREFYCEELLSPPRQARHHRWIELHWELSPVAALGRTAGVRELFERAVRITGDGIEFEALHPVDALLHRALVNAFHHGRDLRLIWLMDVALLAQQITLLDAWGVLQKRCGVWRARLAVELSLRLACAWIGLQLPAAVADFSAWPQPTPAERHIWDKAIARHTNLLAYLGLYVRSGAIPPAHLVRMGWHLLFPDPAWMRLKYPPAQGWRLMDAYLRRWRRWFTKGFR
jgi:hypothetical protein